MSYISCTYLPDHEIYFLHFFNFRVVIPSKGFKVAKIEEWLIITLDVRHKRCIKYEVQSTVPSMTFLDMNT